MKSKLLHLRKPNLLFQGFMGSRKVDTRTTAKMNVSYGKAALSKPLHLKGRKRRKTFLVIAALLISLVAIVYYQYNKAPLEVANAAVESVSPDALLTAFSTNEIEANKQYLNKVLEVTGKVDDIKQGSDNNFQILLDANDPMSTIACTIKNKEKAVKVGQTVTVKGICTGYLNDVILIKCVLVPHKK